MLINSHTLEADMVIYISVLMKDHVMVTTTNHGNRAQYLESLLAIDRFAR